MAERRFFKNSPELLRCGERGTRFPFWSIPEVLFSDVVSDGRSLCVPVVMAKVPGKGLFCIGNLILLDGFGPVPFLSSWDWEEKRTEEKGNA